MLGPGPPGEVPAGRGSVDIPETTSKVGSVQDASTLPDDWAAVVGAELPDLDAIYGIQDTVLPDRSSVFRAFHATPPDRVRISMLGKDPYPKFGMADGLAFSQPRSIDRRSALHRLFLNLERDVSTAFVRPTTGGLSKWASNGVLLLNSALTVRAGSPASHVEHWSEFVKAVIRFFDRPGGEVAFMLLGHPAIELALPELTQVEPASIIRAAHPMAGEPGRERPFHTARVFSEANAFLGPSRCVNWSLT